MNFNHDYWVPQYKWQLVDLLCLKYPNDRAKFQKAGKKQLYAILFKIRRAK